MVTVHSYTQLCMVRCCFIVMLIIFSVSYSFSDFVKNVLVLVLVLLRCEIVFLLVCYFR